MTTLSKSKTARRTVMLALAALGTALAMPAHSQDAFPTKPISVIVPYAPGGQGDVFARLVGERLTRSIGQNVIVENQSGGSGALGAVAASRAEPDGYTLLLGQTGEIVVNPLVMPDAGYDPAEDFAPVALVGDSPLVLVVPANSPYEDVASLIEAARAEPDSIAYASSGNATPGHLAALALGEGVGAQMAHVPYRGAGQALTDVMGGQVDMFFSSASAAMGHIQGGTLKALAVSTPERLPALADVPTISETVLPDFSFSLWGGFFAPSGVPETVIDQLSEAINAVLAEPDVRERLESEGSIVEPLSPAGFADFVAAERGKYAALVEATGVRAE